MVTCDVRVRVAGLLSTLVLARQANRIRPEIALGFERDLQMLRADLNVGAVEDATACAVIVVTEVSIASFALYPRRSS